MLQLLRMVCTAAVPLSMTCLWGEECQPDVPIGFRIDAPGAYDTEQSAVVDVFVAPQQTFSFDVSVVLVNRSCGSQMLEACAGLFAMGVAHDADILRIAEMTVDGTDYANIVTWGDGLVREASKEGTMGFIMEDPLCLVPARFVLDDAMSVVRVRYSIDVPFGVEQVGETVTTGIRFLDGLKAQNGAVPVSNEVTTAGDRFKPCTGGLTIRFHVAQGDVFIRCDPNSDGRLTIADAVWILNELFLGGAQTMCPIAADCDGDGQRNITDAVFGLTHLFLGGPAPPAPYPLCGRVDVPAEECPAQATSCLGGP